MSDLEEFLQWANQHGHLGYLEPLVKNFQAYKANRKEMETQALRERIKDE